MENQIREFTKRGNRRRLFKRVVSLLCVVVLLFTMNTLKRNANTLERIAMCGLQEHTHTAGCYNSSGELVCAIPEHVHTDACYQQSPSDDLVLNGDDLEIADGLVDAGDTQSLDLSLDLDQGDLLDFVQDSDAPASNVQDIGNDMPVLDGDLVFDTSYNNEETQQLAANTSVEEAQGAVDETQSEEAQQLLEEEQIAVEDGQDQSTGEGQEQITFEEDQEQPVEQPTEAAQEQPVEEETEQPVEEKQEQPVEEETEQPVEGEQLVEEDQDQIAIEEQPVVAEQEQPVEEVQEQLVIEEQEEPVVEEQEEPVVEAQEEPAVEAQEEPVVEEQEEPVIEEQEEPVVEEQEEPAVEEQEEPVVEEQEEPVAEEQEEPVVEEQEEPVVEEQEEPVVEEQEEPVVEEQEEPAVEEQEEPVVEEQEEPAIEEQEEPVVEEQEEPAIEEAEQPAEEEAEQPAEEEAEQPAEEEAEQPAEEEAEQPTEEEAEQPAEEEAEQPTEEEAEQPAEEETEEPTIEKAEQLAEVESDPEAEGESEEEPEAQIAYPAKQFQQGTAYINVSVDAPEGAFPEGTVMVVKDVEDQGTIDNIQQSVAEDFVEVTSVHAVDISFWYDDAEIEPLLPIAVVMSAVEAPNEDHETVVVHVDDNGETQLVDSEATGAAEAALEMPAAADAEAQAFEADTFSVYALVTKQVIETKYIDDHGDTWRIKVDYGKDAKLPEGASLQVSEVTDETYLAQAEAALESGKRITKARFFDIKIMDGDREVQPDGQVQVTVTLEGDEGEIEATENQNDIGNPDVVAMHFVEQDDETVSVEKQSAVETDEGVVFHADGFSTWGVIYTVDFEVEGNQGEITLDFTAFDATTLPEEGAICYNTEDCSIHVALGLLADIVNNEAEAGYDIDVNAALVDNYEFDFDKAEMGKSDTGLRFEDGELIIASDGFVELTEGERLLRVRATGLTALKQALLETEGVSIEVISGNVPLGSEASYTAHTDEETAELVNAYFAQDSSEREEAEDGDGIDVVVEGAQVEDGVVVEETEDGVVIEEAEDGAAGEETVNNEIGYSAADLKIVRGEETLPVEGLFKVTVDKSSLIPKGMKLDKLFHIHDGEVEELEVEETEKGLVFEVRNFSDIVARYTVEFHNGDEEVVIQGGSQVLLSRLIEELGLTRANGDSFTVDEVASVEFDDPELFTVEEVTESPVTVNEEEVELTTAHDFLITSEGPFDATGMRLVLVDGEVVVVGVTDAGPYKTTIKIFDSNAEIVKNSDNTVKGTVGDLMVPDPAFTDNYYVLATLKTTVRDYTNNREEDKYWYAIEPVDLKNLDATSTSVTFENLKSVDGNETHEIADGDAAAIKTRLIHSGATALSADNFALSTDSSAVGYALSDFNADFSAYKLVNTEGAQLDANIESAYEFGGNPKNYDGTGDEIHIKHQPENRQYSVRLRFSEGSTAAIVNNPDISGSDDKTNNRYYVLVEVIHNNGTKTYGWGSVAGSVPSQVDTEGWLYRDIPITEWHNDNGNKLESEIFTGHEPRINVSLIKSFYQQGTFSYSQFSNSSNLEDGSSAIYGEGAQFHGYTVHYDTRASRGDSGYYTYATTDGSGNPLIVCYDQIDLTAQTIDAEYDYRTILGPNVYYGIVAEHLYQPNHLQTNFAVNHFSGHGHDVRPDLSGDVSGGNIVIGEFNISDGSKRNSVGEVATDPTWGRLKVGKPLNGTLLVYADRNSGYFEGETQANVYDNPNQTVVVPVDGPSFVASIVEPGIQYMQQISATLANKAVNYQPILSGNKALIDTTAFDENATIYIDGDAIKSAVENPGGITINKLNNQTIVFNFTDKTTSRNLNITQFTVNQPNFANWGYPNGYKTESPEATGSDQNKVMDDIARHIVWNLAACTRKVTIDTAGGMFLQPNDDSEIEIKGTTAGWIVSDGYVYNGTAEWHNVFEEMVESNEAHMYALKMLNGKLPVNKTYTFKLDMLKFSRTGDADGKAQNQVWKTIQTKPNEKATVSFDNIRVRKDEDPVDADVLERGWNIFRISEVGGVSGTITDSTVYYAAVYVDAIVTALNKYDIIKYTVTDPVYYTSFDEDAFIPFKANADDPNPALTGMGGLFTRMPVFENETVTKGLTLMKKVDGTEAVNKMFTFEIEIWKEDSGTKRALDADDLAVLTITPGRWSDQPTEKTSGGDSYTYAEVKLQNGKKVTIDGLPQGAKYRITEIKIGNKAINSENDIADGTADGYIDAYKPVSVSADGYAEGQEPRITEENGTISIEGTINDIEATYAVTYVNDYKAEGDINLGVTKALKNEDNGNMSLVQNMFEFTLTRNGKTFTAYNAADGTVTFPEGALTFTQEDMAGATLGTDGYMSKEVNVVISEGRGNLTDAEIAGYNTTHSTNFDYNKVSYEKDKVITLVLTDKGDGTIEVKPKDWVQYGDNSALDYTYNNTTMTVSVGFENKLVKKAKAKLVGTKTMVGKKLSKAEFTFNAKLIRVDSTDVSEAGQEAAREADAASYSGGTQNLDNLMAKRAQASPADFSGYNEATPTGAGTAAQYTSNIVFPDVYYTANGTYIYEITEDTAALPDGVTQKEDSTKTYYAKVEVNGLDSSNTPNVTYYKSFANGNVSDPVQSDQVMNFINESTNKFEVTKSWLTAGNTAATGAKTVTFKVYNVNVQGRPQLSFTDLTGKVAEREDNNTNTTVTLNNDGTVKLTSDSEGHWPVAVFTGLEPGRYQIVETAHTESGNVTTRYTVDTTTSSTGMVRTGQTLTIVNKESKDTYTSIQVTKNWKVEGQEGTYTPATGSAQFELWQQMTTKGGSGGDEISVRLMINNGGEKILKGHVGEFVSVEFTATVNSVTQADGAKAEYKYYAEINDQGIPQGNDYTATAFDIRKSPAAPLVQGQNYTIVYRIPIEEKLPGDKAAKGLEVNIKTDGWTGISVDPSKIVIDTGVTEHEPTLLQDFEVTGPDWTWSSSRLPVSLNDGAETYKYFIKETGSTLQVKSVTYTPAGTVTGQSGAIAEQGGTTTFTATNTVGPGALKLKKLVTKNDEPDNSGHEYFFTLQPLDGSGAPKDVDPMYIKLWITNNQVDDWRFMTKGAYDQGSDYYNRCNDNTTLPDVVFGRKDSEGYAVIPNLEPGDYLLTELNQPADVVTTIVRGDGATTGIVDAANRQVKLTVAAGDNVPETAVATFTNNKVVKGSLEINKALATGSETAGANHNFTFMVWLGKLTHDEDGDSVDWSGFDQSKVFVNDEEVEVQDQGGWKCVTVTITGAGKATVTDLPAGTVYQVDENDLDGWKEISVVDDDNDSFYDEDAEIGSLDDGTGIIAEAATDHVTVTNKRLGSLKLKKVVTVNGATLTSENSGPVLGKTYHFTVVGPAGDAPVTRYVLAEAHGAEGEVAEVFNYYVSTTDHGNKPLDWYSAEDDEKRRVDGSELTIEDLEPGQYTITEDTVLDDMITTVSDGTTSYVSKTITVNVTLDVVPSAEVTYTNDYSVGKLSLRKVANASTMNPVNRDQQKVAGTYKFTLVGPVDANNQTVEGAMTKYVQIYASYDSTYKKLDYSYEMKDVNEGWNRAQATALGSNAGVIFDHLKTGDYLITETAWELDTTTNGAEMHLDGITVSSGKVALNTVDRTLKVHVDGTDETEIKAVFTNELVPNTMTHRKMVLDVNDSTDTDPFNSSSEQTWEDSADYDIGDEIPYRVTGFLPQSDYQSKSNYYYRVDDVMQNLEYVDDSGHMFAFVKGPADEVGHWYQVDEYFNITTPSNMDTNGAIASDDSDDINYLRAETKETEGLKAIVRGYLTTWGDADTHENNQKAEPTWARTTTEINPNHIQYLQFRYKAELLDTANIGQAGNANDAKVYYDNSAEPQSTGWDRNRVFTYKVLINKTYEGDGQETTRTEYATFALYKKYMSHSTDGLSSVGIGDGAAKLYAEASKLPTANASESKVYPSVHLQDSGNYYYVAATISNGLTFEWDGLDDGSYILVELSAPKGYVPMEEPIRFSIVAQHDQEADNPALHIDGGTYVNVWPESMISSFKSKTVTTVFNSGNITGNITNQQYPGIKILKIDETTRKASNPKVLQGAKFKIEKWNGSTYVVYKPSKAGSNPESEVVTTDQYGVATFPKVEPGEYKIIETKVPDGYVKLELNDIFFSVAYDGQGNQTVTRYDKGVGETGRQTIDESTIISGVTFEQAHTARQGDAEYLPTVDSDKQPTVPASFTVGNTPGVMLPATGGVGTGVVYGAGAALLLLAVLGLILLNRKRTDGEGIR